MTGHHDQPFTILIAALGGEGGGVLMNWIVDAARASGFFVQATSVPGVAQRTGSTSYYIEMMRPAAGAGGRQPVFALVPMPGRVDVVVASELVEAGRMMERGFVSPARTTLIASTSRFYTTAEKIEMADGRFPPEKIEAAGRALARRFIALDLDQIARDNGTLVSATMFGALAGANALPFGAAACERAIGDARSSRTSLSGFRAALDRVRQGGDPPLSKADGAASARGPSGLDELIAVGRERCADYQDKAYADLYAARMQRLSKAATARDPVTQHALEEAARRLALWMTYEDIPRVAELKTRPDRFAGIRRDAEMTPGQILRVTEVLKPGAEEIAAILPVRWGARLSKRIAAGKSIPFAGRPLHVTTTSTRGWLTMRLLARLKSWRPRSLRYREEQEAIEAWLAAMERMLPVEPVFAAALAELPRVLKGYGDTHARGRRAYRMIFDEVVTPALSSGSPDAPRLRKVLAAAMSDADHVALNALVAKDPSTGQ
jgi:indolepyruvate ferredoxin oxidoreductase beta subunit